MRPLMLLLLTACSGASPVEPTGSVSSAVVDSDTDRVVVQPASPPDLPGPDVDVPAQTYALRHLVVAWRGAAGARSDVTRDRAGAWREAERIHRLLKKDPKRFPALARAHSDGPSAPRGGVLGGYRPGAWHERIERAVASVRVGEVGPIVSTEAGYHLVQRLPVTEARAAVVRISHAGVVGDPTGRSREQAAAQMAEVRAALDAGVPFPAVAASWSDDPTASRGGLLGLVGPDQLPPRVSSALFALAPGSDTVIDSPQGLVLVRRLELDADVSGWTAQAKVGRRRPTESSDTDSAEDVRAAAGASGG